MMQCRRFLVVLAAASALGSWACRQRADQAIAGFQRALALDPDDMDLRRRFGLTLCRSKQYARALEVWREGLKRKPGDLAMSWHLAWWLATCPDDSLRDGTQDLMLAEEICRKTGRKSPEPLDALAAAYAETGQFDKGVAAAKEALSLARPANQAALVAAIESRLALYQAAKPYHQPP